MNAYILFEMISTIIGFTLLFGLSAYTYKVVSKAHKEIEEITLLRQEKAEPTIARANALMQQGHDTLEQVKLVVSPEQILEIAQAYTINFMAIMGAENLKEMGLRDEQLRQINMARMGFRRLGYEFGEGLGLNKLAEQYGPIAKQYNEFTGGGDNLFGMLIKQVMPDLSFQLPGMNQDNGPQQASSQDHYERWSKEG